MFKINFLEFSDWEKRYNSLRERIDDLKKYLDSNKTVSRIPELYKLVECLDLYVAGSLEFYIDGFDKVNGHKIVPLNESINYPPDHIFRSLINQPFEDVLVIEHIAKQRINAISTSKATNILDTADSLAWDALQPAIEAKIIPKNTTVITYFQKTGQVRIIPYAPVALIGIPFTAKEDLRDLLAIPHEVGHYVYRRAGWIRNNAYNSLRELITYKIESLNLIPNPKYVKGSGTPKFIDKKNLDVPIYIQGWIEEIFSDFYGCCVAGATIAVDFQDLQKQASGKAFVGHDGEHPAPILRPRIYSKILHERSLNGANLIEERWDEKVGLDPDPSFMTSKGNAAKVNNAISKGAGLINTRHVERILGIIINEVTTDELTKSNIDNCWDQAQWWKETRDHNFKTNDKNEIAKELYIAFENRILPNWELQPKPSIVPDLTQFGQNCDSTILDENDKSTTIKEWPAHFFPDLSRPVQNGDRDVDVFKENKDSYWWVWDVLFRAGWNTFGNGDWVKGP